MHRFQRILWIYEPAHDARERAAWLASTNHAELTIGRVAVESTNKPEQPDAALSKLVEDLRAKDIAVRVVTFGSALHADILKEVGEHHHDLVVIAERTEDSSGLFNSTAQKLIRSCPCAVWVDKPGRIGPLQRVLAAIDPSEGESRGGELGRRIVEVAACISLPAQAELHVLNAWKPLARPAALGRVGTSPQEIENVIHEEEQLRRRLVEDVLRESEDCLQERSPVTHIVLGAPEIVLPELVASLNIDILVIGTWGRSGIAGFFLGNIAESVLGEIQCAVLAVKMNGSVPQASTSPPAVSA